MLRLRLRLRPSGNAASTRCASTSAWGLSPRLARRLTPTAFDALPAVTLSGILDRPAWQRSDHERAARAYADALASQRDMVIFNVFMRATMGEPESEEAAVVKDEKEPVGPGGVPAGSPTEGGSDAASIAAPRASLPPRDSGPVKPAASAAGSVLLGLLTEPHAAPPSRAAAVFLERATALFQEIMLGPTGLPSLGPLSGDGTRSGPGTDEQQRAALARTVLHPELADLLLQAAAQEAGPPARPSHSAAVARVLDAKVVDAWAVWDGTMRPDDVDEGLVVAEERGRSISLRTTAAPGGGPLLWLLSTFAHFLGLHPLRRAALRVTVAFKCSEQPPAEAEPVAEGASESSGGGTAAAGGTGAPPRVAIHTLTLESEAVGGRASGQGNNSAWAVVARLLDSMRPGSSERSVALRYLVAAAPVAEAGGWRVVSIDGTGSGGSGADGYGHGVPAFSRLFGVGRDLARPRTAEDMRADAESDDVAGAAPACAAVAAQLDALQARVAALRHSWCGRGVGSSSGAEEGGPAAGPAMGAEGGGAAEPEPQAAAACLPPRLGGGPPYDPLECLGGLSVGGALDVVVRIIGAAARAAGDVGGAPAFPPWVARAELEAAWEAVEAAIAASEERERARGGQQAEAAVAWVAPLPLAHASAHLRSVAVRELRRADCFEDAAALEAAGAAAAAAEVGGGLVSRADLARVSAALARVSARPYPGGAAALGGVAAAAVGVRPAGDEPWELLCDRRQRLAVRRAVLEASEFLGRRLDAGAVAHLATQGRRVALQGELHGCLLDAELLLPLAVEALAALLGGILAPAAAPAAAPTPGDPRRLLLLVRDAQQQQQQQQAGGGEGSSSSSSSSSSSRGGGSGGRGRRRGLRPAAATATTGAKPAATEASASGAAAAAAAANSSAAAVLPGTSDAAAAGAAAAADAEFASARARLSARVDALVEFVGDGSATLMRDIDGPKGRAALAAWGGKVGEEEEEGGGGGALSERDRTALLVACLRELGRVADGLGALALLPLPPQAAASDKAG